MRMLQTKRSVVKQAAWQIPSLMVLASIIAFGVNQWRADGIPLVGNWSVEARFADAAGESLVISIEEARRLFAGQGALFLDARPSHQYSEGHIQGALSLPWQDVDRYFGDMAGRLEGVKTIITYCDGDGCDLSHELRLLLGAVFLLASFDKILHPQAFAQTVYNYQILTDGFVNLAAIMLPWLELLLGVCLSAVSGSPAPPWRAPGC